MTKMNVNKLIKELVSIPSYVTESNNEVLLLKYIENFFIKNVAQMKQERQFIDSSKKRYNFVCKGNGPINLIVLMHVDTVQPQAGWKFNPLLANTKDSKIYGLGTADMKGSIAAFLTALVNTKKKINIDELMLLFYVDEEYDFKGMKRFIKDRFVDNPRLILSLDGSLELSSGCRGTVEMNLIIRGESGHSSKPFLGINVISKTIELTNILGKRLEKYCDRYLGPTTLNIAYVQGGIVTKNGDQLAWQREGNIIPDFIDITVEVRPAVTKVNADFIIAEMKSIAQDLALRIEKIDIRHDIKPWPVTYNTTQIETIKNIYKKACVPFRKADRKYSGYVDMQMLVEKTTVPLYVIGTGGENLHAPNENVLIKNLMSAVKLYEKVLETYCKKYEK